MNEQQYVSVADVARQLNCSRGHVYNLIAAGHFRTFDIATPGSSKTKTRLYPEDVEAYIARQTTAKRAS